MRTLADHMEDARRWTEELRWMRELPIPQYPIQLSGWRPTMAVLVDEIDRLTGRSNPPASAPDTWTLETAAARVIQCRSLTVNGDVFTLRPGGALSQEDRAAIAYLVDEWDFQFRDNA